MVDETLLEATLDHLTAIPSASGTEHRLAEALADHARAAGLQGELLPAGEGRTSCLVRSGEPDPSLPHVLLSGHIDTLPPPPGTSLPPGRHGDRYVGPEVNNMLAAVAAMLTAQAAVDAGGVPLRVTLLAAASECDTIGLGTVGALGSLGRVDAAINGEPTDLAVLAGHSGVARLHLEATGAAAHVSQRSLGHNAIDKLVHALSGLDASVLGVRDDDRFPGLPILNVGTISGGVAASILAPDATAAIDVRYAPGTGLTEITAAVAAHVAERVPDGSVTVRPLAPPEFFQPEPYLADPAWPIVLTVRSAHEEVSGAPCDMAFAVPQIYFGSDAPHLVRAGIPTVMYGPGKVADINRPDESIAWADVVRAASVYEASLRLFATSHGAA